jgi:hypothetical protein
MGNWGNTKDRWYRRAAIVMWPRERSFAARAEASASWALSELRRLADDGDLTAAGAAAESAASFWAASVTAQPQVFEPTLRVAALLDAPEMAAMLLRQFQVEMPTTDHSGALSELAGQYGPEWMNDMIGMWFESRRYAVDAPDRMNWIGSLPGLCEALRDGRGVARGLLTASWDWLGGQIRFLLKQASVNYRSVQLGKLGKPLVCLLQAAAIASETGLRDEILGSCASAATTWMGSWSRCCERQRSCPPLTGRLRAWTTSPALCGAARRAHRPAGTRRERLVDRVARHLRLRVVRHSRRVPR